MQKMCAELGFRRTSDTEKRLSSKSNFYPHLCAGFFKAYVKDVVCHLVFL